MKTIYVSHGEKGGVGKSTMAMLVVDRALTRGHRVAIVETDLSVPDVQHRFEGVQDVVIGRLSLSEDPETAIAKLGDYLERRVGDVDTVVVNAPAGASATLDTYASVIDAVARDVGATLAVSFCLGPSAEVVSLLDECLAHGLLGIPHARRAIVLAGFLGDPAQWPWSRAALRDRVSQQGVREFVMPRLTEYVMSQVRTAPGRLNDLAAAGGGLTIASRSLVYRWLRGAAEVADFILGEETVGERDVA